ncbi:NAD-P-binding protein [Mycena rebaudengoi]|nr:NAD-P-binding protein [Mycena rebaudengoi]
MSFNAKSTAEEVATSFSAEIKGKNVLITGTSLNGIGFEAARVIAKHANLVIITGYNAERLKASEDAIKKETPSANIRHLALDLSSIAAVRKAAAEVNAYTEPIDVLVNNAAAPIAPFKLTADGLEAHMSTDLVGPFLFTNLIKPRLLASRGTPRVVVLASDVHHHCAGLDLERVAKPDASKHQKIDAYAQAKAGTIMLAVGLAAEAKGKLNVLSVHPGLVTTNLVATPDSIPEMVAAGVMDADGTPSKHAPWKNIAEGAAGTVVAAFDPSLNDKSGAYIVDCQIAMHAVAAHSSDPARAKQLWSIAEGIVGEKFSF